MYETHKDIQKDYIEVLRKEIALVLEWWSNHCPYSPTELKTWDEMTDFHRRWPTGPAGHPQIIAIFRKYFFATDELNDRLSTQVDAPFDEERDGWGEDMPPAEKKVVRPIDLLVNDLANIAPDLFDIMQGFFYVPIGMDPDGEVC